MKIVISRDSVKTANVSMIKGTSQAVSVDACNVSVRHKTNCLTFSRDKITTQASKAFGKIVK